jgi:hypothetical protein
MPEHFGHFLQATGSGNGVFLVKQSSPIAAVIEELVLIWSATDAAEWTNRILTTCNRATSHAMIR